jgi:beta-mannanase
VDWVACDGYNRGTSQPTSSWRPFSDIIGASPSVYRDYRNKPFMVAETGSCEQGGDKARWIDDIRTGLRSDFPNVRAIVWFDAKKLCDWRASSSDASLAAYRAMASDPYFNP